MSLGSKETGKQRSGRIPLDYFQRADRMRRLRRWLTLLACGVSAGWLILAGFRVDRPMISATPLLLLANHGPLAKSHAPFEHDCEHCHKPFTPIDGSGWVARSLGADHASDQKCQVCHSDVPAHYASETESPACASCHHDHRGRDVSMIAIAETQCTSCHKTLKKKPPIRSDGSWTKALENVAQFDADHKSHPEFALHRLGKPVDPGQIQFNHALHMTPGLPKTPNGLPLKTIEKSPQEAKRSHQADSGTSSDSKELVQLRCDSCHQLSSKSPKSKAAGGSSRRGIVDFMAPINYDLHCKACHPNNYDQDLPALRHGLTPSEVHDELWNVYSSQFVQNDPELKSIRRIEQPIPGRSDNVEIKKAQEAVTCKVKKAESLLFEVGRCGECHKFESLDGKPLDKNAVLADLDSSRVTPSAIATRWLFGARFDHSAHPHQKDSDCVFCHKKDSGDVGVTSTLNSDVLIPRSDTCRSCHGPSVQVAVGEQPKAGNHCTECHNYHADNKPINSAAPLREVDGEILRWIRDDLSLRVARGR